MPMRNRVLLIVSAVLLPLAAAAEVKLASPDGLVIEHRFAIAASPRDAWDVLVHPEPYWPDGHTWSGDAAHLSLVPEAGGCFCERWTDAGAEHGRVVMAIPGRLLRFRGSLGSFQEMALTGVLTVTLEAREAGTEAVVTYRLSGDASHRLGDMAALEVFTRFGSRLEASIEAKIRRGRLLRELLKQERLAPLSPEQHLAWLIAYNERCFDGLEGDGVAAQLATLLARFADSPLTLDSGRDVWREAVLGATRA